MQRNPGVGILRTVAKILQGEGNLSSLPCGIGPGEVALFKLCPITSVYVERSFSIYKNILSDQRQQLTQENIKNSLSQAVSTSGSQPFLSAGHMMTRSGLASH